MSTGTRRVDRQKKRYKDCLKENFKLCEIDHKMWEVDALDRAAWRRKSKCGVEKFEENRRQHQEDRRAATPTR